MKKILSILLLVAFLFAFVACDSNEEEEGQDILNPYFTGKVIEIYEKSFLVEVTDVGNGCFTVGEKVEVNTDISNCSDYAVGDSLTISFDGKVALSYPPQIFGACIIGEGDGSGSGVESSSD